MSDVKLAFTCMQSYPPGSVLKYSGLAAGTTREHLKVGNALTEIEQFSTLC